MLQALLRCGQIEHGVLCATYPCRAVRYRHGVEDYSSQPAFKLQCVESADKVGQIGIPHLLAVLPLHEYRPVRLVQEYVDETTRLEYNNASYITSVDDSEPEERSRGSVGKGKE
jgi:hypothetical protein